MSVADLLFCVLALTALTGAMVAALWPGLRRAAWALLIAAGALALLSGLLGAWQVAVLQACVVVAAATGLGYLATQQGVSQDAEDASADPQSASPKAASASPDAEAELPDPARDGQAAHDRVGVHKAHHAEDAPQRLWASVAVVLAFVVLISRAVLMARWPLLEKSRVVSMVGLPHVLLAGLSLFSIGLLAAITRRSAAGIAIGVALMTEGAVLALVAVSHFVAGSEDGTMLAALVVVLAAVAASIGLHHERLKAGVPESGRVADGLLTVVAAVTLALLAGAV